MLAALGILTLLGRNDTRDTIEYYGTFSDGEKQQNMVWTVSGAANVGLPSEFAERVLVALLYIGAQNDYAERRMEFTPYQILTTLGHSINGRNYGAVELALNQLTGVLITSDKAWIEKKKDGTQRRVTTKRGFHIIDEYYLHYTEDDEEKEGDTSFIVWGSRIWKNLQAGYIRRLDIDFYYSIDQPLARRLYRFLDKVMHYKPNASYAIDVFDLANKLGLAQYQYASQVKRLLTKAADELIAHGYLGEYDFFKVGKYTRIRFSRCTPPLQMQLFDDADKTNKESGELAEPDPWLDMLADMSANVAKNLKDTRLVSLEDGTATIQAGKGADWLNTQLAKSVARELKLSGHEVDEVVFVE